MWHSQPAKAGTLLIFHHHMPAAPFAQHWAGVKDHDTAGGDLARQPGFRVTPWAWRLLMKGKITETGKLYFAACG
uniref:Uncharacterized protein n=1 Tax=mine drainage metagenome TaxID=410659 RepID=E6QLT8_9ZZZZ